jgi:hypothetical protein
MIRQNIPVILTSMLLLLAISILVVPLQLVIAQLTLTNPGQTVTYPDKGNSRTAIAEHVGKGAPCEAFENDNNPVTGTFSPAPHPLIC